MKINCQDELLALDRIDAMPQSLLDMDPEVTHIQTAKIAALAVDWMGFKALVQNPVFRNTLKRLPVPEENESDADYIKRVWPLMEPDERGTALDMGIEKMVTMGKLAETGIHLRIWQAFVSGEWQYSPTGESEFRPWVGSILVDVLEASSSEATKLANVCEAIAWLEFNDVPGVKLPKDLESCFKSPEYRRWDSVSSKILARASALEGQLDPEVEAEVEQEIAQLVEDVYSEKTGAELAKIGRGTSRIPPIKVTEEDRDEAGLRHCYMQLSDAQYRYFCRKLDRDLDYRLEGEQPEGDQYILMEYRLTRQDVCTGCGAVNTRFVDICTECNESDKIQSSESLVARQWASDRWTSWVVFEDQKGLIKVPDGIFDSVLSDPDMGLEYIRQWEVVPNA